MYYVSLQAASEGHALLHGLHVTHSPASSQPQNLRMFLQTRCVHLRFRASGVLFHCQFNSLALVIRRTL